MNRETKINFKKSHQSFLTFEAYLQGSSLLYQHFHAYLPQKRAVGDVFELLMTEQLVFKIKVCQHTKYTERLGLIFSEGGSRDAWGLAVSLYHDVFTAEAIEHWVRVKDWQEQVLKSLGIDDKIQVHRFLLETIRHVDRVVSES